MLTPCPLPCLYTRFHAIGAYWCYPVVYLNRKSEIGNGGGGRAGDRDGGGRFGGCYGDDEATEAAKAHVEEPWREAAAQTRLRGFSAGWDVSGARGGRATPSPIERARLTPGPSRTAQGSMHTALPGRSAPRSNQFYSYSNLLPISVFRFPISDLNKQPDNTNTPQ